jgi:hypothetical protein
MSRDPATIAFTILQQHGLCPALLEVLAAFCQTRKTGCIRLHVVKGEVQSYELHEHGKVKTLQNEYGLTNV